MKSWPKIAELESLRPVTRPGDYVVVEDGITHLRPGYGPGPAEALAEYHRRHPDDYEIDVERETKFGFTYAPGGWLRRR